MDDAVFISMVMMSGKVSSGTKRFSINKHSFELCLRRWQRWRLTPTRVSTYIVYSYVIFVLLIFEFLHSFSYNSKALCALISPNGFNYCLICFLEIFRYFDATAF